MSGCVCHDFEFYDAGDLADDLYESCDFDFLNYRYFDFAGDVYLSRGRDFDFPCYFALYDYGALYWDFTGYVAFYDSGYWDGNLYRSAVAACDGCDYGECGGGAYRSY